MAEVNKKVTVYTGGIEGKMSTLAIVLLVLNALGALIWGIIFIISFKDFSELAEYRVISVIVTLSCIISGASLYIILEAGAEVIRLLKKQNGLNYGGEISKVGAPTIHSGECSACGSELKRIWMYDDKGHSNLEFPNKCPKCGESLQSPA